MSNYDIIKNAVENKLIVIGNYNGYYREMCPHALGTKNGRQQCLFYQFGGFSSSGPIIPGSKQNWRCIPIDQLQISSVISGKWETASNHSTPSTCIDFIDVEVVF